MNDNLKSIKGYYSLLQYVPDLERSEGVNVGIVLFCPDIQFLKIKTDPSNDRIRRFFGHDREFNPAILTAYKDIFSERLEYEFSQRKLTTLAEFEHFVDTRANVMLLTKPRWVKVYDPEAELEHLFQTLVGTPVRAIAKTASAEPATISATSGQLIFTQPKEVKHLFTQKLTQRKLTAKITSNLKLELPLLKHTQTYPVAYHNGALNVVKPVVFGETETKASNHACRLAVEGTALRKLPEPAVLRVLAGFKSENIDLIAQVTELLGTFQVKLYRADEMDMLIEEIERNAHE
ncbi:MAG: DUF3037 domain-containing protein [Acidobacteria bacterium]|nr:DUF3037 domain-containing protein [Acidobacteriota bacterium]